MWIQWQETLNFISGHMAQTAVLEVKQLIPALWNQWQETSKLY